jgi:hypothetical protein
LTFGRFKKTLRMVGHFGIGRPFLVPHESPLLSPMSYVYFTPAF